MCIRNFVMIVAVCFLLAGCNEQQIEDVDEFLADANSVGSGITEFVRGPAGAIFPPIVRTMAEVLGLSLAAALGLWQKVKHNLTKGALKAVTKGVDNLKDSDAATVKKEIAEQMKALSGNTRTLTYSRLNAEVDKAKAS